MEGEHATSIDGEGRNPAVEHIMRVAEKAGLDARSAKEIISHVRRAVKQTVSSRTADS